MKQFFQVWILLTTAILLVVWALPHTIAARNIALFTGLFAALCWLILENPKLGWKDCWPSICLLLVPAWVLFHWYFISILKDQQWQELSSTWLRVCVAVLLGSVSGIMISKKPRQILWIISAIILLPTITFVMYLHQVYLVKTWILPTGMYYGAFKQAKFSMVYFVVCQALVGFGLIFCAIQGQASEKSLENIVGRKNKQTPLWSLFLGVALVLIALVDFIAVRGLNGIIVSGMGFIVCVFTVFYQSAAAHLKREQAGSRRASIFMRGLLIIILIGAGLYAFWSYDQRYEGKLSHLAGDIQIATQIDQNQTWIRDGRPMADPVDLTGRPINGSTYERVSWFIKGLRLIQDNPLGNGVSHQGFGHYMRAEYPKSTVLMTHSAWVDFTLGLGLPGLVLTWLAILGVISKLQRNYLSKNALLDSKLLNVSFYRQLITSVGLWLILGMFCFWVIGEVSEREYIEHYFFLVALFGMALYTPPIKNQVPKSPAGI
ncbi:hypothetical protein [Polynucleobacter meluiroseus]|uniref:hypothetical protein n=1 Tax=Polynucleobacter meluiroseus TaxID=1938814 RepID=UPI0010561841|nr:hypothetical protein [Polynucleobacter meluiroseus]